GCLPVAACKIGLFDVLAPAEHRLGAMEPQRLDVDLDLALLGRRDVELLDLQDLGPAGLMESYYPCHGVLLLKIGVCGCALHNQAFGTAKLFGTTPQPATSRREVNSPIMMLGALVLAEGIVGMTEAS